METTIVCWGYIGVMLGLYYMGFMLGLCWGYIFPQTIRGTTLFLSQLFQVHCLFGFGSLGQ